MIDDNCGDDNDGDKNDDYIDGKLKDDDEQ